MPVSAEQEQILLHTYFVLNPLRGGLQLVVLLVAWIHAMIGLWFWLRLKPWYRRYCKRPTFNDEYLPAFNRPNVHLIDASGGIERITSHGTVAVMLTGVSEIRGAVTLLS